MQLITNRIYTGNGKRFEDYVKEHVSKQVKTASTNEVIKKAEQEEAESSGQLKVEPLHQTGESTEMPKKGPSAKKDTKDKKAAASDNENKKDEAEESTQIEGVEPLHQKGESTTLPKNPNGNKASSAKEETKEAGLPDALKDYQFKKKDEEDKDEEEKDNEECEKKCEDKTASDRKFVKIANLDAKNKAFLKKYWGQLFGEDYVNALLADK